MKRILAASITIGVLSFGLSFNRVNADKPATDSPFATDGTDGIYVFDPSMTNIQQTVDSIYTKQQTNQFGNERYALLFKPGTYNLNIKVGYYTQVLGLGASPDEVNINGTIQSLDKVKTLSQVPATESGASKSLNASSSSGSALDNFWRGVENISITPPSGTPNIWAVSQASPMRRVHVIGNLNLWQNGYSSGGFLASTQVDKSISSGTQQQWMTRNSQWATWNGGNWNMVFMGNNGAPDKKVKDANTVVVKTPVIAEKPYLTVDANNQYSVVVPNLQTGAVGSGWRVASNQYSLKDTFYVAKAKTDNSASIQQALDNGKNILFTPGYYDLDAALIVKNPNTIILGLGLSTLHPVNNTPAIIVNDVDGVRIAGLLLDAGPNSSGSTMIQVGDSVNSTDHSKNPTILYDLFCRVGGTSSIGQASSCVTINSNNVIGDNFWLWRADHGENVGWDTNKSDTGLIVNGNGVLLYGLAVEHFQKYQTEWNGNNGQVVFYQSEMPYDVPDQSSWQPDNQTKGYASYKLGDKVSNHKAYGLGVYCFFNSGTDIYADTAILAPNAPGISFTNMLTVHLSGNADTGINHVINDEGGAVSSTNFLSRVNSWPQSKAKDKK